ncbi:hypothetical protein FPSE_03096 [Fusarium pseudograminearum CS3096]|uniref:5-demethoxyubiquinone hydroxylase, mitochondrial n=1 Tax=Fusarium pseudograminearum (strain CS3096) TaxID=1028729 RepID=K3W1Y0_FUSPC|nr:hypothetical protein FPSE_03096 [Fusarium pseudograminearum CS3096]EKJ76685.1 hypothetical protein FPSE_03096 [Fusarium pseudograminearum CS3096]
MASSRSLMRPLRSLGARSTPTLCRPCIRTIASTANAQAAVSNESSKTPKNLKPLTQEQRDYLDSALRVNQAGELAAVLIYAAQSPILVRSKPHLRKLMSHMYDQEDGHFKTFNGLIHKHRVRPTAMYPLWSVMATGLGWSTAMMGYKAAMACTEAVETEIGGHYNEQIRTLLEMVSQWEAEGYEVGEELSSLVKTLRVIRDEELEHLDHAVEHDAQKAEPHWLLTGVIRAGCRGAIWTYGWHLLWDVYI